MLLELGCTACKELLYVVSVTDAQMEAWRQGTLIQFAFPEFTDEQRELLITGVCDDCWEEMNPEEEDEMWSDPEYYGLLDPESDWPEYDSDYYVSDEDCD